MYRDAQAECREREDHASAPTRWINGQPVADPRKEYARPLLPSWTLALFAAALVLPFMGRIAPSPAQPAPRIARAQAPLAQPCGPTWQVRRLGASSYTASTIGGSAQVTSTACAMPIERSISVMVVHLSGDTAHVSTGLTTSGYLEVPAGGWWLVPVDRAHHTLVVIPDDGGAMSVTVYAPNEFPANGIR